MAELVWDNIEERTYETGIDRGVVYPFTGPAVVWNGLTKVINDDPVEFKPYYYEGRRVLERLVPGAYSGKIEAITYPDVIDELTGISTKAPGIRVHNALAKPFHMSYRTLIGTPGDGIDHGYKLHLVYYLLASFDDQEAKTIGSQLEPTPFSWTINGMQRFMEDNQPLDHLSIDSRYIDSAALTAIENQLYGRGVEPSIPDPRTLVS